jgi:hypothetical protein
MSTNFFILLRNTRQKAPGQRAEGKREVFLSWVTRGTPLVGGSYLAAKSLFTSYELRLLNRLLEMYPSLKQLQRYLEAKE